MRIRAVSGYRKGSECGGRGLCDGMILFAGTAADANSADDFAIALERDVAGTYKTRARATLE
jgi:hypothetical protein